MGHVSVEVYQRLSVVVADRAAIVNLALVAQVDTEFQCVRTVDVREVVDQLNAGEGAKVAHVILQRRGWDIAECVAIQDEGWIGQVVRIGIDEVEDEAVHPGDDFIGHGRARGVTPGDGQIAWLAQRVHDIGRVGNGCRPPFPVSPTVF